MSSITISNVIYGALFFIFVYIMIRDLYTVVYTPGSPTLYDSPIVQRLFPNIKNKMLDHKNYFEDLPKYKFVISHFKRARRGICIQK